jgi:geranylgeranyl diphosphate/geranylgeranyl-bacteriochlorophyllide a reductase
VIPISQSEAVDVLVVGGGPSGATAARDLAQRGHSVQLLDRDGRIKPCGGAIPPRLIKDFDIPDHLLCAKVQGARMIGPSHARVDMPISSGFVGMVDRHEFDEWLRQRAVQAGAERISGTFVGLERTADGITTVSYRPKDAAADSPPRTLRARTVIGADGANSGVARAALPRSEEVPFVFAYHEIIETPRAGTADFDSRRCDVLYRGDLSPDFYTWVFPHGATTSVGVGSAQKGFSLRGAVAQLRQESGMDVCRTIRREGAPIPMKPRRRWDDGRSVLLAGDAAGVVAPASGEGIYYAMVGGQLAAEAVHEYLATGDARNLGLARERFMRAHGRVFWILGLLQYFFYCNDKRRTRFVAMCRDKDVQRLTWESYMNKELVRSQPMAHMKILVKDMAHLMGFAPSR